MLGERLEDMLARIQEGLGGRTGAVPIPPALDGQLLRTSLGDDLLAVFVERAQATGAEVLRTTIDDLPGVLLQQLEGVQQASLGFTDPDLRELVRDALSQAGVQESEGGDAHFASGIGITDVELAIAETGTLGYTSASERPRAAAFVAPVHLALVRAEQVVPDLVDYLDRKPLAGPSSELLITGPSKTADIEGILVRGVHGPGVVRVFLIK